VLAEYPDHPVADMARLSLAGCLEEQARYAEAANLHGELAEARLPSHLYDEGRCWELAGAFDAAREAYRKAAEANVPDDVREIAEARLAELANGRPLESPPKIVFPEPAMSAETPPMLMPAETPPMLMPEETPPAS